MLDIIFLATFSSFVLDQSFFLVDHCEEKNKEGWYVAKTKHFNVFHKKDRQFAERVARTAEATRLGMNRKWFGCDGGGWEEKCELILHEDGQSYVQMTGLPLSSPGHSRIEMDITGRVISRRVDLRHDVKGMMEAILPHEATHIVLAGHFGSRPTPRWADEGISVLSETKERIEKHRHNFKNCLQEQTSFGIKELMELKEYPSAKRLGVFYGQSVCLTEFLVGEKGPIVFTKFVREGVAKGYEVALQHHYGYDLDGLAERWNDFLVKEKFLPR